MMRASCPATSHLQKSPATNWQTRGSSIDLDETTILWRNADIEQERRIAISI